MQSEPPRIQQKRRYGEICEESRILKEKLEKSFRRPTKKTPFEERFWLRVNKNTPTGCWEWLSSGDNQGYGRFWFKCGMMSVHKISWLLSKGKVPQNMCVCHTCDNRKCVNPDHLWLGTHQENMDEWPEGAREKGWAAMRKKVGELRKNHRLTNETVKYIRETYPSKGYEEMAKELGVSPITVYNVIRRTSWKHLP